VDGTYPTRDFPPPRFYTVKLKRGNPRSFLSNYG